MLRRGNDDKFFLSEWLDGNSWRCPYLQETHKVERFGQELAEERLRAIDKDLKIHPRTLRTKTRQSWHHSIDNEVRHANGERPGQAAFEDGNVLLHGAESLQRLLGIAPEPLARGRQAEASAGAFEQRDAEGLPERTELEAHGRLGCVQIARDFGEVAAAGDRQKGLELMEGDSSSVDHNNSRA